MEDYKKETIDSYNKHPEFFANKFKQLMNLKRRYEFKRFIDLLSGKNILDLGCGSGDHSDYFIKQGLNVTSIDLSEEMIRLCKQKDLNAQIMDIEDLKFPNNSFDGIWSVTSLLHIPKSKIHKVVRKLNKMLKTKGILYVCVKKGEGEKLLQDNNFDSKRFFSFWNMGELREIFEKEFNVIESKEELVGHTTYLQLFLRKI